MTVRRMRRHFGALGITRLARQHDCTAKVADGKLIVMPRQGGVTASGKTLGVVTINKTDVSRYSFRLGDRSTHKAVRTKYQDKATGKLAVVNLSRLRKRAWPRSTAPRPVYGWKCPGARICSQNG